MHGGVPGVCLRRSPWLPQQPVGGIHQQARLRAVSQTDRLLPSAITITSSAISIALAVFISFSSLSLSSTGTARGSPRRSPASASLVMTQVCQPAGGKPRPDGRSTRAASTITSWLRVRHRPKRFRIAKLQSSTAPQLTASVGAVEAVRPECFKACPDGQGTNQSSACCE